MLLGKRSAVFRQVMSAGVYRNPFQELLHCSAFQKDLVYGLHRIIDACCSSEKTVLEVVVDFPASSSVVPTNSQLPGFGQQPARTRKNKTHRVVPGQQRLLRRGRSAGMPVAERSLEVVSDRCRRQSAGVLRRTATAKPPLPDSGSLNVRFEEGDITIDDAEFRKSVISFRQQLSKSYRGLNYLNNPELDRSEFAEWMRYFAYFGFMVSGFAVTTVLLSYANYKIVDHFDPVSNASDQNWADILLICFLFSIIFAAGLSPLMHLISYYLANNVAAVVDAYEKKVVSTSDESSTEQFLKKYDRMESLLDCLKKLRSSTYLNGGRRRPVPVRDLPKLVVSVSDSEVDGQPLRHVTVEEKPKLYCLESLEFYFYFYSSDVIEDRRNLEAAIVKTRNWLDRAEKQVRLIRGNRPSGA